MDEMKMDMLGAASVMATMKAIAELKIPINIVGVIPTVENMPDGKAIKPGDVLIIAGNESGHVRVYNLPNNFTAVNGCDSTATLNLTIKKYKTT